MLGIMVGWYAQGQTVQRTVETPQVQPVVVQRPGYGPDSTEDCLEVRTCDHAACVPAVRLDS